MLGGRLSRGSEYCVRFVGGVTIASISEAYAALAEGVKSGDPVVVNLDEVSEADLTLAQLLEAARRTAAAKGQAIRLERPADGAVLKVLQRGGFLDSGDADRLDFWSGGKTQS